MLAISWLQQQTINQKKRNAPLSVTEKHTPTNNNEYRHLSSWRRTISLLSFMLSSYIFLATFPLVKRNACGAAFIAVYSFIYAFFLFTFVLPEDVSFGTRKLNYCHLSAWRKTDPTGARKYHRAFPSFTYELWCQLWPIITWLPSRIQAAAPTLSPYLLKGSFVQVAVSYCIMLPPLPSSN